MTEERDVLVDGSLIAHVPNRIERFIALRIERQLIQRMDLQARSAAIVVPDLSARRIERANAKRARKAQRRSSFAPLVRETEGR